MWVIALHEAGLLYSFLNLIFDLTYGAPISNPPSLMHTFIHDNLKSEELDLLYMDNFLASEVGWAELTAHSLVAKRSTMFLEVTYKQLPQAWSKSQAPLPFDDLPSLQGGHLSQSTNRWIDSSFNTKKYYSAADTADFLSSIVSLMILSPLYHLQLLYNPCILYMAVFLISILSILCMPWRLGCMFLLLVTWDNGVGFDHHRCHTCSLVHWLGEI